MPLPKNPTPALGLQPFGFAPNEKSLACLCLFLHSDGSIWMHVFEKISNTSYRSRSPLLHIGSSKILAVHRKVNRKVFCCNFKNCSLISIKFGRRLQQLMLNSVCQNYSLHLTCVHTLPCNVTRDRIVCSEQRENCFHLNPRVFANNSWNCALFCHNFDSYNFTR